jgi:hypothetical protein
LIEAVLCAVHELIPENTSLKIVAKIALAQAAKSTAMKTPPQCAVLVAGNHGSGQTKGCKVVQRTQRPQRQNDALKIVMRCADKEDKAA